MIAPRKVYWDTLFSFLQRIRNRQALKDLVVHQDLEDDKDIEVYKAIPLQQLHPQKPLLLSGYFRHRNHFWDRRKEVLDVLWKHSLSVRNDARTRMVKLGRRYQINADKCLDFAFMHFRRGDYKRLQQYHPILSMKYYQKAVKRFPKTVKFLVFCEEEDRADVQKELWNVPELQDRCAIWPMKDVSEEIQLMMMALCRRGGILANSTYRCWGAYFRMYMQAAPSFCTRRRLFVRVRTNC